MFRNPFIAKHILPMISFGISQIIMKKYEIHHKIKKVIKEKSSKFI